MRYRFRELMSIFLMILGLVMLARGVEYIIQQGLGWQGMIQALIAGVLVFALGFTRWRYLRQR
jgi:uncharacterized protein YybS (DUF2232 family)